MVRIGIVAPPFLPVPPARYGGTELFIAQLAERLPQHGMECVVFANGESTVNAEVRSLYPQTEWPLKNDQMDFYKDLTHATWASDHAKDCDVLHVNSAPALALSRRAGKPIVYTIHHPLERALLDFYKQHPEVDYVAISDFQRRQHAMPKIRTIHHGIRMQDYQAPIDRRREYFAFLGRIAPVKGTHNAIAVAQRTGIPLKIAGQVQPIYRDYYEMKVKPHIDGKLIEYIGEVDLAAKNELLGGALALLFPIEWHEPFGLVMIEAMACGSPVLAFPGGSVEEVVQQGIGGYVCRDVDAMVAATAQLPLDPAMVRAYAAERFSVDRMVEQYVNLYRSLKVLKPLTGEIAVA
jgi:glycosyltransferase involved in cell wall biosynthesis